MILSFKRGDSRIAHFENIYEVHRKALPLWLRVLERYNPIYAGGYPMALLFAPRRHETLLDDRYYSDFDIYFQQKWDLIGYHSSVKQILASSGYTFKKYETQNAISYNIQDNSTGRAWRLQLIKKTFGTPKEILTRFDFKNCAVAFSPQSDTLHFHKQAPRLHLDQELDVLNPWMIYPPVDLVDANVVTQILRFNKYCKRWNYKLSLKSIQLLLEVYNKHPNIIIPKNMTLNAQDSPSSQYVTNTSKNEDLYVWNEMSNLFTTSEYWLDSYDVHGLINSKKNQSTQRNLQDIETSNILESSFSLF